MDSKYILYEQGNYYIKSVVCDYGIYWKCDDKLILILNSYHNAIQIVGILNEDDKKGSY